MEFETTSESSEKLRVARTTELTGLDFRLATGSSRNPYRKLVMLVLMLIGVIYAMVELGKPERWYWLIPPESSETNPISIEVIEPKLNSIKSDSGANSVSNSAMKKPDSVIKSGSASVSPAESGWAESSQVPDSADSNPVLSDQPKLALLHSSEYPASAQRFWTEMVRLMSSEQRRNLCLLLKRARHRQELDDETQKALKPLIASIRKARSSFHEDLLNRATYAVDGPKQAALANDHFEAESTWDRSEWPAISSFLKNEPLSDDQQLALRQLQAALDPMILKFVMDRTAQGWEGDSPAWGRMWERLMFEELPTPTSVTHLELSAQPETYRNLPISVRGWVRGAWQENLAIPELGIKHLYVLVVRPEDSKVTPYFLYARELPTGFPNIQKKYQALNQRIECQGLFFKIRTYLDTERQVQTSPMILVDSIIPVAAKSNPPMKVADRLSTTGWWFVWLVLLPLIAAGVAWFTYQTTRTIRFQPGPNRTREIHQSLGGLVDDPDVKTNAERIRELYE